MSLLARLVAREEGFGKPGSIPTLRHNPGDLRHSPHSSHPENPQSIGTIDTDADGWADLERQLLLYAGRGLTLKQMIEDYYAPPEENDSANYLKFVCEGLGCTDDTLVSEALKL